MKKIILLVWVVGCCSCTLFGQGVKLMDNIDVDITGNRFNVVNEFDNGDFAFENSVFSNVTYHSSDTSIIYRVSSQGDKISCNQASYHTTGMVYYLEDDSYVVARDRRFKDDAFSQISVSRYTVDNNLIWEESYTGLSLGTSNSITGGYILPDGLLLYGKIKSGSSFDPFMFKVDWNGVKEWEVSIDVYGSFEPLHSYGTPSYGTPNYGPLSRPIGGAFMILDSNPNQLLTFFGGTREVVVDLNGTVVSNKSKLKYSPITWSDLSFEGDYLDEFVSTKIILNDGNELGLIEMLVEERYESVTFQFPVPMLVKYDAITREKLWTLVLIDCVECGGNLGTLKELDDGNFIYIPYDSNKKAHIIDPNTGNIIVSKVIYPEERRISINNVFEKDGYFMCVGSTNNRDENPHLTFFKLDENLNTFDLQINYLPKNSITSIHPTSNGEYVGALTLSDSSTDTDLYIFKADSNGVILSNEIEGKVYGDLNNNCLLDPEDLNLEDWEVQAKKGDLIHYAYTDSVGNYQIQLDTGNYELNIIPKNDYWLNCDTAEIEFLNFFDSLSNVDLTTGAISPCSFIEVDVGFGFLRRCFSNRVVVQYCNQGTFAEEEAMVELHIDSYLDVDTTSIPIISQEDTTLFFDIGELGIGECGKFTIHVTPNCDDTVLGQEHCINAHVFPDTLCVPADSLWSGANVVVEAICLGDSTLFNLINMGGFATKDDLEYIVIVDDIIVSRTDTYSLEAGESIQFVEYEPGSTITVIAEQEPFHPLGNQVVIDAFCAGTDFDFISSFNQYDDDPFTDIACIENRGAFDPNDKAAVPVGSGPEHFISAAQDLEYKIRFQNTGTDTAFTVVVRDTISDVLDMSTFEAGISSHDYTLIIEEGNILVFTFDDILLPDSTINWTESNGFVEFRINQVTGNLPGTLIENTAAIYFDFNEPVITNTVFHTIETPVTYSITSVDVCSSEMYNSVIYTENTTISELVSTQLLDSFAITEINVLPVDSVEQFQTLPAGSLINNIEINSDTTIYEYYNNSYGCDSILIRNFMIEQANSIALIDENHWEVFPNPTKDVLTIRTNQILSDDTSYTVRLYSILGTTVYETKHDIIPNKNLDLNVSDLTAGTYVLTISSKHGMITKKVVVNP